MMENLDFENQQISQHPILAIEHLLDPICQYPWYFFERISVHLDLGNTGWVIMYIGFILAFIIAAIVAGLSGGNISRSFGGWSLTIITCMIILIMLFVIDDQLWLYTGIAPSTEEAIVTIILAGLSNLIIYGCITIIVAAMRPRN